VTGPVPPASAASWLNTALPVLPLIVSVEILPPT
jgi:hypothetical protein